MITAIIPARFKSSRFPGKPLKDICGKPMIQWVYERTEKAGGLDSVCVATDDPIIFETVRAFGGEAVMTSPNHKCGSDRIAECANILGLSDEDIILNIQGDEPLISPIMVEDLISCFSDDDVVMGTLAKRTEDISEINDPNVVKVVVDLFGRALMFSRCPIPYNRDGRSNVPYLKHIGAYGYRKSFLDAFSLMGKGFLEQVESLEQLRALENGYSIRVVETAHDSIGVDTPDDLERVKRLVRSGEYERLVK